MMRPEEEKLRVELQERKAETLREEMVIQTLEENLKLALGKKYAPRKHGCG